eukprot:326212-Amphidinium_carterae.1
MEIAEHNPHAFPKLVCNMRQNKRSTQSPQEKGAQGAIIDPRLRLHHSTSLWCAICVKTKGQPNHRSTQSPQERGAQGAIIDPIGLRLHHSTSLELSQSRVCVWQYLHPKRVLNNTSGLIGVNTSSKQ